jgi:predicted TIM-barrel fold metal-dependent hydrolase
MDDLLAGRRDIRAAGSLREVLSGVGLVDHHAHGILRDRPTLDEFRGLFSESPDPRQWPHVASGLTYRRAVRELATLFGVEPSERSVYEHRLATDFDAYASTLLRSTGTDLLLVDDGFPPPGEGTSWQELGDLAGCTSRPIMRIERVAEETGDLDAVRAEVTAARANGFVGLKTVAAYRGGLDLDALRGQSNRLLQGRRVEGAAVAEVLVAALEANEATGAPLPVQVHAGFGDSDLFLPRVQPGYLKPLVERFRETTFVLLHCYPFVREAGWLAHVYGNVFFDLSLTIPHVSRPAEALREALELAPISKLLYASDAARTPELYHLAAKWWRDALAEVLAESLPPDEAEEAGRAILRENALRVYDLEG